VRADSGLVLYWKLDETAGTMAADSSGSGFTGVYVGTPTLPAPSMTTPPKALFADPRSLQFVRSDHHAVQLPGMTSVLKMANNLTVTAWYRATSVDVRAGGGTGSEILSAGNQYSMRILATQMEFSKRITTGGNGAFVQCRPDITGHLDGNWHHMAGVTTPAGMKLYFDGVEKCTNTTGGDIRYDQGPDFWLGRHGFNQANYDFEGNLDEVRVYNRPLAPDEIAWLAQGGG
jgi:hypothetical protein